MLVNDVIEQSRARIAAIDPKDQKAVGVFQWKNSQSNWGEKLIIFQFELIFNSINYFLLVFDLKDLKVYEGTLDNPDATLVAEPEVIVQLMSREATIEDLTSQVRIKLFNGRKEAFIS